MPTATSRKSPAKPGAKRAKVRKPAPQRLSHTRRPAQLSPADWQTALRRQFGAEQGFALHNLGSEPVFSEFAVHNPASGSRWRVAIRGAAPGQNFSSCPDFATTTLGTCKHIEFTLARLAARRGGKAALRQGFAPAFSEVWLDYAAARVLRFRAGSSCPPELLAKARADRRRNGPGQDRAGDRRSRAVRAPFRRRPRAGGLPDLAQAPVEEGARALHGARGPGHPRPARRAREALARRCLLPHRELRDAGQGRRPDRRLGA